MTDPNRLIHTTQHLSTPLLLIDQKQILANIRRIQQAIPQADIYYAVKCNADPRVLETVQEAKAGFEIASISEAETLKTMDVPPDKIMCLHPIKSPEFLQSMHRHGIDVLAADSMAELDKLAEYAPGSRVVIRVSVNNLGSVFPLNGKFGVEPGEVIGMFHQALKCKLIPWGITIHVGSQCERTQTWVEALGVCREIIREADRSGMKLNLLSLGGGLPAPYAKNGITVEEVGAAIQSELNRIELAPDCSVSIEPGRAIAASAGTLITTVIGLAERSTGRWAYLDAGVYNGLFESCEAGGGISFPISVENKNRPLFMYNIGGPTCDSFDMPFKQRLLPELHLGDRVAIQTVGAYSTELSSTFNGFPIPSVYSLNEVM
ncbi:MAG: alanine racemase [Blastocatellales bacterium]|nr:alanine racemase [Nitrosomonas nitrosa]